MTHDTDGAWPDRATLRTLLRIAAVIVAAWGVYDHVIAPILRHDVGAAPLAERLGEHLLLATPLIFYVCGIWQLARFLEPGERTAARLASARSSFLSGAVAALVVVPTLLRWIAHRGGFDLAVDGSAVAVAALALCLPFVAAAAAPTRMP